LPDCEACEEHRQRKVKFCSRCGNRVTPQATPWPPLRHLL
jgi:NADH pyrophosphatase NudC (nudix superfamily)